MEKNETKNEIIINDKVCECGMSYLYFYNNPQSSCDCPFYDDYLNDKYGNYDDYNIVEDELID